jgi:phage/plasmid-associated DNA primase
LARKIPSDLLRPRRSPAYASQELSDSVSTFLADRTEVKLDGRIRADIVYEAYLSWCEQEKRAAATFAKLGRLLNTLGVVKDHRNNRSHYLGMNLRLREMASYDEGVEVQEATEVSGPRHNAQGAKVKR